VGGEEQQEMGYGRELAVVVVTPAGRDEVKLPIRLDEKSGVVAAAVMGEEGGE